jgi:hypothetical protein
MKKKLLVLAATALVSASPAALAQWHTLLQVTRVSVMGGSVWVRGATPSGATCTDLYSHYGTLYSPLSDAANKHFYAMAFTAQMTQKGLSCYVVNRDANGVCQMDNCYVF